MKTTTRRRAAAKRSPAANGSEGDAPAGRIAQLEAELAAARQTIAELMREASVRAADAPSETERELTEKTNALEHANQELRNLTQNLDQIVRQRTRALAESEAQLRRKNLELDRLNRIKSEFISIAAHELRTPMTSIVGYLDLILDHRFGELPTDLKRPITSLHRNAQRLKRLIEDLLDASRIESGRLALRRAPCSFGEIVDAVVDEMRPLAEQKDQKIYWDESDVAKIDADADKVHQVVANLVANSVKYTAEGGEIRVTLDLHSPTGDGPPFARLRVWDNGIGVPAALRARIFEPFSDVHTAKHHTSSGPDSAGLGLYIARGIVELHGGLIEVDSEEGRFAEFTVFLPLARAAEPDPGATSSSP